MLWLAYASMESFAIGDLCGGLVQSENPNPKSMEWVRLKVRSLENSPSTIWISDGTLAFHVVLWRKANPYLLLVSQLNSLVEKMEKERSSTINGKKENVRKGWRGRRENTRGSIFERDSSKNHHPERRNPNGNNRGRNTKGYEQDGRRMGHKN